MRHLLIILALAACEETNPDAEGPDAAPVETCATWRECRSAGKCGGDYPACVRTEAGCRASLECEGQGHCALSEGFCRPDPAGCAASIECRTLGFCFFSVDSPRACVQ